MTDPAPHRVVATAEITPTAQELADVQGVMRMMTPVMHYLGTVHGIANVAIHQVTLGNGDVQIKIYADGEGRNPLNAAMRVWNAYTHAMGLARPEGGTRWTGLTSHSLAVPPDPNHFDD